MFEAVFRAEEDLAYVWFAVLGDHPARAGVRADPDRTIDEACHPSFGGDRVIAGDVGRDVLQVEGGVGRQLNGDGHADAPPPPP